MPWYSPLRSIPCSSETTSQNLAPEDALDKQQRPSLQRHCYAHTDLVTTLHAEKRQINAFISNPKQMKPTWPVWMWTISRMLERRDVSTACHTPQSKRRGSTEPPKQTRPTLLMSRRRRLQRCSRWRKTTYLSDVWGG